MHLWIFVVTLADFVHIIMMMSNFIHKISNIEAFAESKKIAYIYGPNVCNKFVFLEKKILFFCKWNLGGGGNIFEKGKISFLTIKTLHVKYISLKALSFSRWCLKTHSDMINFKHVL